MHKKTLYNRAIRANGSRPTYATVPLKRYFSALAQWLKSDPRVSLASNPQVLLNHPAFRKMVAEGEHIIPLILQDFLDDANAPWELVLEQITGLQPYRPEHRGFTDKIRQDWIEWGYAHGHIARA
jgi:hypothetical protein